MFRTLLGKECKMWLKSIIFYAYIIILFLFYMSQMGTEEGIEKPCKGQDSYGFMYSNDKNVIMNSTLMNLVMERENNRYATYPIGFYKGVQLSESEQNKIDECIGELTGMTISQVNNYLKTYEENIKKDEEIDTNNIETSEEVDENSQNVLQVSKDITYTKFKSIMKKVCNIIGKGSAYEENTLRKNARVGMTYEDAMAEYNQLLKEDKITSAYARLFSDYMGLMLGILPAFFSITRIFKDKKSKVKDVIYSKKASSFTIIMSRLTAIYIMLFIPILVIAMLSMAESVYVAKSLGVIPNYLSYGACCVGWLLPIILFVSTLTYAIALVTESILTIVGNLAIWFIAVLTGANSSELICVGMNFIPRFNYLGKRSAFEEILPQLIQNRIFYVGISIVLILSTVFIYNLKRQGGLNYGEKHKNSLCESKA